MADVPNIVGMSSLGMNLGQNNSHAGGGLSQSMQTMSSSQMPDLSTLQQSIDNMHNDLMQHPWDSSATNAMQNMQNITGWFSSPVNVATPYNADAGTGSLDPSPSIGLSAQPTPPAPSPMPMASDYASHIQQMSGGTTGTETGGGPSGMGYGADPFTAVVNAHNLQGVPWPQQSNSIPGTTGTGIGGLSIAGSTK